LKDKKKYTKRFRGHEKTKPKPKPHPEPKDNENTEN